MKDAVFELRANPKPVLFFGVLGFVFVSAICIFFAYYILVHHVLDEPGSVDIVAALVLGFPSAFWLYSAVRIWRSIQKTRALRYLVRSDGVTVLDERTGDKKAFHSLEIVGGSINRVPFGRMIAIDRGLSIQERPHRVWGIRIWPGEFTPPSEEVDDCLYLADDAQVEVVLSAIHPA